MEPQKECLVRSALEHHAKHQSGNRNVVPADLENFKNVSSIVLSTALRAPGNRDRATAIPPSRAVP